MVMAIIPRYEVASDKFDPEKIVDVLPEQAASNAKIQASEANNLNALITNSERQFKKTDALLTNLGNISESVLKIAEDRRDKYREDKKAQIAFDVLTQGISPQLEGVFRGERDLLFEDDLNAQEFANKVEAEGDSTTAQEFRKMAGWQRYALAEAWVKKEAKGYDAYYYQALETETVTVNRNGVLVEIGGQSGNQPETPAEQAALDSKIKFNYARRFAGLNEGLIATVLKPEIDKYDEKRSNQQSLQREKAYQIQVKEADKEFIENSFITANPADGFANADKFARRFAARERTSVGVGRLAFADYLVNAVSNDDITYPEAMSIINHEEQARDGSMKSMTSWKEWEDLPERLSEAASQGIDAREKKRESMIAGDLENIRTRDDWTNEEKQYMREIFRQKYDGSIPSDLQGALLGHEEDWEAEDRLGLALRRQNGVLYDYQVDNVSNDVYQKYQDKVVSTSALVEGTAQSKLATQYIRTYSDRGTNTTVGAHDAATEEWINLNRGLTSIFNAEYQKALYDENGVKVNEETAAFEIARAKVEAAVNDPETNSLLQLGEYDFKTSEAKVRGWAVAIGQAGGGQWKINKIYAPIEDQNDLLRWSKTKDLTTRGIPEHYKEVAQAINVSPFDLAQRQVAIISEGESEVKDRDVDEIENKPNRARLLYHYPTRSRVIRSLIDYGYEIENIDPNVKTSIFNKKVLTTPGV